MQEVDPEKDQRAGFLFDKLLDIAVSSHRFSRHVEVILLTLSCCSLLYICQGR
jgi:hypothetical protein